MHPSFGEKNGHSGRVAEIDLRQIENNFNLYLNSLPKGFEIIAVVKADAYGHGAVAVAKRLSALGVRLFAVATLEEGIRLRRGGVSGEILILGYTPIEYAESIYTYGLTQTLIDESYARELAAATDKRLKVQLAIDTGMKRIGLDSQAPYDCERVIRSAAERFELNGIFTFDEKTLSLRSSHVTYRLADKVTVKLEEADILRGKLRFSVVRKEEK